MGLGGGADPARLAAALELHRTRARTLQGAGASGRPLLPGRRWTYDPALCAKFVKDPALPEHLEALRERLLRAAGRSTKEALEAELRALAEERGVKAGVLIHPTRMALSGATGGPPLFDLVEVMGREATARHLERFTACLRAGIPHQPQRVDPNRPVRLPSAVLLGGRSTVGHAALDRRIGVRIPASQPSSPSSTTVASSSS